MPYVRQRHKTDCGIAALAMLCGVTYEEADQAIPWRRDGHKHGTTTAMLRQGALKLGYATRSTPKNRLKPIYAPKDIPSWELSILWLSIPGNSLVKIPHPKGSGYGWHWVVWRNKKVYDPARGVFRKFDTMPSSYMEFIKCEK